MKKSSILELLLVHSILLVVASVRADSITLTPIADTSLFESIPDNNLGAQSFLEAGVIKPSGALKRLRGLVRFDLSQIPTNAVISNATLRVTVVLNNTNTTPELLELHRMLQPWTEGNKSGGTNEAGILGAPATDGESTWNHRQYPSLAWASPGGSNGVDFVTGASSTLLVYSTSNYTFSSGLLATDVRQWVANGVTNFGWMLKSTFENTLTDAAARRFGSREDASNAPVLTVIYGILKPVITTSSPLPIGTAGTAYYQTFFATGSKAPYSWSLDLGTLPGGLSLTSSGILSGTPTNSGTFNFSVRVADSNGESATNSFALTINPGPLHVTTSSLPAAVLDLPYSDMLTASGGIPPYTWTLISGSLPDGLMLNSDGWVSGAATNVGTMFEVQVTDSLNTTATAFLLLSVNLGRDLITHEKIVGGQFSFQTRIFAAQTNVVQFRDAFDSGDWATLTNITTTNTTRTGELVTVTDSATGNMRFYRFYYINSGGTK